MSCQHIKDTMRAIELVRDIDFYILSDAIVDAINDLADEAEALADKYRDAEETIVALTDEIADIKGLLEELDNK